VSGTADPAQATAAGLPFGLRLSFGVGSLGTATVLNSTSILLLFFMTNLLGLSPALGGALLFISKVVDVASNPVIGMLSDRTRTRIGRRRPYLLGGGLTMAAAFVMVFTVPEFGSETLTASWLLAGMLVLSLGYATFTVPYLAVAAETTRTYDERTSIMAWRVLFVLLGTVVGTVIAPVIARPEGVGTRASFATMGLVLGAVILLASLWCFAGTRRATFFDPDGRPPTLREQLRIAGANAPFLTLALAKLLQLVGVAAVITTALYLLLYVLALDGFRIPAFFLTMTAASTAAVPLWWFLGRRLGKKQAYIVAVTTYALTSLTWLAAGPATTPTDLALIYARAVVLGVAGGGLILLGVSMLPDTIEFDRLKSGARREGIFTGLWSAVEKGATAVGGLAVGLLLEVSGFVESTGAVVAQPDSAITGIVIGAAVVPAACMLASLPLLARYPLSRERLAELAVAAGR
jgi:GPH family glycoside/pentoside/hexuronide:cation symporter